MIHARWVNLVMSTITSTDPVWATPIPLMTRERRMRARSRGSVSVASSRVQCFTMPVWLMVKEMKTPTT